MTVEEEISRVVDEVCDLLADQADWDNWSPEARHAYQEMLLQRIKNELEARDA